jgi:hypothetical protein
MQEHIGIAVADQMEIAIDGDTAQSQRSASGCAVGVVA